ncbi:Ig-like domain-containing protein [Shewanella khirikhana]|uniref:Bacterial Ig-like domain (Group 2) n=1 Tax=Shewanella khirikhana TaxID=1965282 RepID=A0ABM7CZA0_9GAMM|nr:Ig-like domain-containing protein [Shewanella khirikhana]AZQ09378.1 Bacterial Ig-like domain (group 2) [Shewanella khirikhana]
MTLFNRLKKHLLLPLVMLLGACGGDNDGFPTAECGGPDNPCPPYAVSLSVSPKESRLAVNTSLQYQALATYSDGSEKDVTTSVSWQAADTNVASIAAGGKALALAAGSTRISATLTSTTPGASDLTDDANLSVTDAALDALVVTPAEALTLVGLDKAFMAEALFSDGHRQDVTQDASWSSLNSAVATVTNSENSKGVARGISVGDALIQASFGAKAASGELIVLASQPKALVVSPKNHTLPKGTGVALQADLLLEDGLSLNVTAQSQWQAAAPSVATVDNAGFVSAQQPGQTAVTATLSFAGSSLTDSASITVTDAVLESLSLTPAQASIPVGRTQSYQLMGLYSDGSIHPLGQVASWQSSDPVIATVKGAGIAVGLQTGSVQIQASVQGLSAQAQLTVTDAVATSLVVTPGEARVPLGYEGRFSANAHFSDGTSQDVTQDALWQSGDESVVTLVALGEFGGSAKGVAVGATEVTASFAGLTASSDVTVTNAELKQYSISPATATVAAGLSQSFQATGVFTDGSVVDLTQGSSWLSSDTGIASINSKGAATGYVAGEVSIHGSYRGYADDASLTVTAAEVSQLLLTPQSVKVPVGTLGQFEATAIYTDGHQEVVNDVAAWTVANPVLVSVVNGVGGGSAQALAVGTTEVTVSFAGLSASASVEVTPATLVELTLNPALAQVPTGLTLQYQAFARFSDGSSKDVTREAAWITADSNIARIDKFGLAEGLYADKTQVQARYLGYTALGELTVTEPVLVQLQVTPAQASVPVNGMQAYKASAIFSDGYIQDATGVVGWRVDDSAIASIAASGTDAGKATGLAAGSTAIWADYLGMSASAQLTVTDKVFNGLLIEPANSSVFIGSSRQFHAYAVYGDGSQEEVFNVLWESRSPAVASIDKVGRATGLSEGISQIWATYFGKQATAELVVRPGVLTALKVTPDSAQVPLGTQGHFTATATFDGYYHFDVSQYATWSSSAADVVHVVTSGVSGGDATALKQGSATITAQYGGMSASADVGVYEPVAERFEVTPDYLGVEPGMQAQLTATVFYVDGSSRDVTLESSWQSDDPQEATVETGTDQAGLVTGIKDNGYAIITATYKGMTDTAEVSVYVQPIDYFRFEPSTLEVQVGKVGSYILWAVFDDGHEEDYTRFIEVTADDDTLVNVYGNGTFEGLAPGETLLRARLDMVTGEAKLTVLP